MNKSTETESEYVPEEQEEDIQKQKYKKLNKTSIRRVDIQNIFITKKELTQLRKNQDKYYQELKKKLNQIEFNDQYNKPAEITPGLILYIQYCYKLQDNDAIKRLLDMNIVDQEQLKEILNWWQQLYYL